VLALTDSVFASFFASPEQEPVDSEQEPVVFCAVDVDVMVFILS